MTMAVFLFSLLSSAQTLDDVEAALRDASSSMIQEKVYIHTDNTCYFIGDTIWYKAYVVRADDLNFTDMSRLLYVELLNADGLLVERQNLIVSDQGFGTGNFCLSDSLYSGFYELRAYTRWMLNFNVTEHSYSRTDREAFYSNQMAADFYRMWDGLYSRVIPVYSAPEEPGDFTYHRMASRPKERITKNPKPDINASFYPEGGHLVEGLPCRVAFEISNQEGAAYDGNGVIRQDGVEVASFSSFYMGRGDFTVTPTDKQLEAVITYNGKEHKFKLPKAEKAGVALSLSDATDGSSIGRTVTLTAKGLPQDKQYALSIMCRGSLQLFQPLSIGADGKTEIDLPALPTGVNDITVFDNEGNVLADRLLFVNNHDKEALKVVVEDGKKVNYSPHEQISLKLKCEGVTSPTLLSLSVRDTRTDEATYNDCNIMTDLLLGSELKGFVANPSYYFEADDADHLRALDLLMSVQGWRKYNWQTLADTASHHMRYEPEQTITVEGAVYEMPSINPVEADEIVGWRQGLGMTGKAYDDEDEDSSSDTGTDTGITDNDPFGDFISTDFEGDSDSDIEYGDITDANRHIGVNHGGLKKEVLLEAEITVGTESAGVVELTHNGGRYMVQIPPFYGVGFLKMKAYDVKDSLTKCMASLTDKGAYDETSFPDYYVKRDLFYPAFTNKYNYYQCHVPEIAVNISEEDLSELSMENEDHLLQNVDVKGKRRGRRSIDYTKPAYVMDAYDIYNEITDRGLSFGIYDMRQFPLQVSRYLYGNMGRQISFNVNARYDGYVYYRSYTPDSSDPALTLDNKNVRAFYDNLKLRRLMNVRVFTDYEPRNEDVDMEWSRVQADVTVEMQPFPDDAAQHTFRDRHIVVQGIYIPDEFYCPDYSQWTLPLPSDDYRRTLYWNPNAVTDADGQLTISFYNNSKETRIKLSASGITPDGQFIVEE